MSLCGHDYCMFCLMHVIKLTLIQLIFIKLYIVISNNIVILIKLVELGDGEAAGHQGRTESDPHQPQVSVPLISRPVVSYRKGGTTPLRGVRLGDL